MPRSKTGIKRAPVDSDSMRKAIEAVTAAPDKKISTREACKVYNVKLTTLSRALANFKKSEKDTFSYASNFDINRVFNENEENLLVDYIQKVAKMNYGLSKKGVRKLAYSFAVANKKKIPEKWSHEKIAGEQWMRHFMRRYKDKLSVRKPEATSLSRSTSFNKENLSRFYDNLEDVHKRFGPIPPHRIWNADETGLKTVQAPAAVVAPKGVKQIGGCTSAERGTLITMIVAVNAIGNHVPPMLIFPRVYFKDRMLTGAPAGTLGAATPTGWSNDEMFMKFLEHFINYVKSSKEERVLLIIDNHETHLSLQTVERASDVGIVIVTFPPHTSHRLQPLDVSMYGPLKTFYNQAVDEWHLNHPGKTFDIYCVSQVVGYVFPRAFTPKNILSGFKTPGIFPLDRGVFTDDDFLPSYVSDRPFQQNEPQPIPSHISAISAGSCPASSTELMASTSTMTLPRSSPTLPLRPTSFDPLPGTSTESASFDQSSIPNEFTPERPKSQCQNQKIVTPEQVQPYPKAGPRKTDKRGRKPGRTRIATDTPEKDEIREEKARKMMKKQSILSKKHPKTLKFDIVGHRKQEKTTTTNLKKVNQGSENKKKTYRRRHKTRPKIQQSEYSSSSEEDDVPLVSTDDEDSAEEQFFCSEQYCEDRGGEQWIRCIACLRWAHELCAGSDKKSWKTYVCDYCTEL